MPIEVLETSDVEQVNKLVDELWKFFGQRRPRIDIMCSAIYTLMGRIKRAQWRNDEEVGRMMYAGARGFLKSFESGDLGAYEKPDGDGCFRGLLAKKGD